jgi:DNA polymerase-3 subunit epsilon
MPLESASSGQDVPGQNDPVRGASTHAFAPTFDDLGTPLSDVTFVIVDLETTGGAPADAGITEVGAVKVRGGERIGEFQTLVNPGQSIPPFVAALTGITDSLVATAPRLTAVLPSFLDFARDCVLVAHNAPYDIGFLRGACAAIDMPWPDPVVLDTARLARVALLRDEVRNCKLSTLAAHFHSPVTPTHRALDDARATTDVLHGLLERVANLGVSTLEDVQAFTSRVSTAQRTKRHLADGLPDTPGVYIFEDPQGVPLYVGKSRRIRTRVRSYFTAAEQRRRMAEMVRIAERVTPIPCATDLEAHVREIRIIEAQQPRYNRRSRRAGTVSWLKLTVEPAPRLSVVRAVVDDRDEVVATWDLLRPPRAPRPPPRHCCCRCRCARARLACPAHLAQPQPGAFSPSWVDVRLPAAPMATRRRMRSLSIRCVPRWMATWHRWSLESATT